MIRNDFWLKGDVNVPEDKKEACIQNVLKILDRCGIRKTKEIQLGTRTITVVHKAVPDQDGIISFDYSVFEKKKRETGTFHTHTLELKCADVGYDEFCIAMNLILTLEAIYADGDCCLMQGEEPCENNLKYKILLDSVLNNNQPSLFYKCIKRKNEDEFLEFWNGENLLLSRNLEYEIYMWSVRLEDMERDMEESQVENYLADLIYDLDHDWNCRYVDEDFVTEFMGHKGDSRYRKALVLLRKIMEKDVRYYPELTRRQAIEWVLIQTRDVKDRIIMSAYQSLMINLEQRERIFGF